MTMETPITDNSGTNLDRIMRELDATTRKLPEDAIRRARDNREQMIPRLIRAIEDATAKAAAGDVVEGNAQFFALFLLTEFGAKEGLPAILAALSLPGELPFELFGDAITENLPSMLAALASDAPELLEAVIQDRSLNEYVRGAAADTYLYFVRDGRLTRNDAVERLRHHLREAIANRDEEVIDQFISSLVSFSPSEALDDIREAFRLDLVDPMVIDLEFVEQSVAQGESRFQEEIERCRPTGIADTIAELKRWHALSYVDDSPSLAELDDEPWEDDWTDEEESVADEDEYVPHTPETIRNTAPRVGRNDPCPCGSGKKFKKCCGGRSKER